jgi:hypothetical protein
MKLAPVDFLIFCALVEEATEWVFTNHPDANRGIVAFGRPAYKTSELRQNRSLDLVFGRTIGACPGGGDGDAYHYRAECG